MTNNDRPTEAVITASVGRSLLVIVVLLVVGTSPCGFSLVRAGDWQDHRKSETQPEAAQAEENRMKVIVNLPGLSLHPGTGTHWWKSISFEEQVETARTLERLGYDYIMVPEHIVVHPSLIPRSRALLGALALGGGVHPRRDQDDQGRVPRRRSVPRPDRAGQGACDPRSPLRRTPRRRRVDGLVRMGVRHPRRPVRFPGP